MVLCCESLMFFRLKKSGERSYVQIVENNATARPCARGSSPDLGRADDLAATGRFGVASSLRAQNSPIRCCSIASLDQDAEGALSVAAKRIGGPLLFGRIWEQLGIGTTPYLAGC